MRQTHLLAFLVLLVGCRASVAGGWFFHEFGELRAYHQDFLNVCTQAGHGECRTVQYRLPPGGDSFFGDASLTVRRTAPREYRVEVFVRDLPDVPQGPMTVMVGGEVLLIREDQWAPGTSQYTNVAETFHLSDASLNGRLDRKSTRLNSSHSSVSRMTSSA